MRNTGFCVTMLMLTSIIKGIFVKTQFLRASLIILLINILPSNVQSQDLQWLQYRTAAHADRVVGSMLLNRIELLAEKPQDMEIPRFEGKHQYFGKWNSPMVKGGFRWIALDRQYDNGPDDRLYIDSNGDGKLSDEKVIKPNQSKNNLSYFGPVPIYFDGEDGLITYHLNFRFIIGRDKTPTQVHVTSGGWYEGYVKVGGEKKFCMLIDYNADAFFDGKVDESLRYNADRIRVGEKGARDTRYVGNYIEIDGKFYRLEVVKDGAWVKFEPAEDIKFGQIELQDSITEISACGENGYFTVKLQDGKGSLPEGNYRIYRWISERKDQKDDLWKLTGSRFHDNNGLFEITENNLATLDIGEPIISTFSVRQTGKKYNFSQELKGRLGESINITKNGSRPRGPKLHIKNKNGIYDRSFTFEYG